MQRISRLAHVFLLSTLLALTAIAQDFRGTILGVVTDSSSASIAGATVTATNTATNVRTRATTASDGTFTILFLVPGSYSVSVESAGFKTVSREGITVQVQQRLRLDWSLAPGLVTESVVVTGEVPQLEVNNASTGAVLGQKILTELPQNGRNPYMLARIAPGVMPTDTRLFTRPFDNGGAASISINGAPSASNDYLMDGIPNNDSSNTIAFIPSVEAVAEMKVQSNTYDAEFGRAAGGTVNLTVRSGTNSFHGSAHEFWRNNILDANEFFNNRSGLKRAPQRFHMFGATAGGPVVLPKLYDGHNRTFVFGAWESIQQSDPSSSLSTLPTLLERTGDFSKSFNSSGALLGIFDPLSSRPNPANPSSFIRTPFPGNVIPASAQDPVAVKLMSFYGAPNQPGAPFTAVENFARSSSSKDNYDSLLIRGDHTITDRQRLFVRVSSSIRHTGSDNRFQNAATDSGESQRISRGAALDYVNTLTSTVVLNLRYGFTRYGNSSQVPDYSLVDLGQPRALAAAVGNAHFPSVSINGYAGIGLSGDSNNRTNVHSFQANATRLSSRLNLKWGYDRRVYQENGYSAGSASGTYSFDPAFTRGPDPIANRTTGHAVASFLLGTPVSGRVDTNVAPAFSNVYQAAFVQSDFRIHPTLSINAGLRYDFEAPRTERYNRMARGFAYNTPSPIRVPGLNLMGGLEFAGVNGQPEGQTEPRYLNFAPRFGLAWQLHPRVVFRGGYGLFFAGATNIGGGVAAAPGFSVATAMVPSLDGVTPLNRLSNPFPNGLLTPVGAGGGLSTLTGQSITFTGVDSLAPRTQQYSGGFQFQATQRIVVEATYSGSRGTALASGNININQLTLANLQRGTQLIQSVPNPFFGQFPTGILSSRTTTVGQLLRPYPQFDAVTMRQATLGNSTFHSLQTRVERRFSQGLLIFARYTFSKLIDDVGTPQNNYDLQSSRSLSGIDRAHRLVLSAVYELPFGQGKRFTGGSNPILRKLAEGWQVDANEMIQTGVPLSFSTVANTSGSLGGGQRPNSTGVPAGLSGPDTGRLDRYFDTSQFTNPAAYTFGNLSRFINVRGPGLNNLDVSIVKNTRIRESLRLQIRAESFNVANHPAFADPNTTLGNASFGRIQAITQRANPARQIMLGAKLLW